MLISHGAEQTRYIFTQDIRWSSTGCLDAKCLIIWWPACHTCRYFTHLHHIGIFEVVDKACPSTLATKGTTSRYGNFKKCTHNFEFTRRRQKHAYGFFDQIEQLMKQQRNLSLQETPEGIPSEQPTRSQNSSPVERTPKTKPGKSTFGHWYLKMVIADYPSNAQTPTSQQVMIVPDYIWAVRLGKIPKGPNHATIEELAKKPHAAQTQVIVLSYSSKESTLKCKQPKST